MEERGVSIDHSSINRWTIRFLRQGHGSKWRSDKVAMDKSGANKAARTAMANIRISGFLTGLLTL